MQNFSESFLALVDGMIVVPTGNGAEAFVDAADIAAVATETLLEPGAHHGRRYAITGPEALTVAQAAAILGEATSETIRHQDVPPRSLDVGPHRERGPGGLRRGRARAYRDDRRRSRGAAHGCRRPGDWLRAENLRRLRRTARD
jgi:uncharacterized protein YbjT (DUF2867 family)